MNIFSPSQSDTARTKTIVLSPITGVLDYLDKSPDPVFAGKMLGDGCIIHPESELIYAPFNGYVLAAMPHAVGIKADTGEELLIHVGIDTVELQGKGFQLHVKEGDRVSAGDILEKFSIKEIQAAGFDDCIMCVITNTDAYAAVTLIPQANSYIKAGEPLLYLDQKTKEN